MSNIYLRRQAKTDAQIIRWLKLDNHADLLCASLQSRFGAGFGNPIKKKLDEGEITKYQYNCLMALTDWFQALWNLIQSSWEALQPYSEVLAEAPCSSEVELYRHALVRGAIANEQ